jgi:hypothetical protein
VVGFTLGRSAWPLAIAVATMGCASLALWAVSRRGRVAPAIAPPPAGMRGAAPG